MMEFLDKLFGYEYFGPILFGIIAVLIVIFFIVLFFGKKDEKERILEETRRLKLAEVNAFKEESESAELVAKDNLDLKGQEEIETKTIDPVLESFVVPSQDGKIDDKIDVAEKKDLEPVLTPVEEVPLVTVEENMLASINEKDNTDEVVFKIEPSIPTCDIKYNFEELANSIARELESLEKVSSLPVIEEEKQPEIKLNDSKIEITPIKEIQKNSRPVFSSVFVEPVKKEQTEETKEEKTNLSPLSENNGVSNNIFDNGVSTKEIQTENNKEIEFDFSKLKAPKENCAKQEVVLPKAIEIPKKKEINETTNENICIPDFTDIEGESYNINN